MSGSSRSKARAGLRAGSLLDRANLLARALVRSGARPDWSALTDIQKGLKTRDPDALDRAADYATDEEIVHRYPSLDVARVYEVIACVLRNRGAVDEYLAERGRRGTELQVDNEQPFPPDGIRARLIARRERNAPGNS